MTMAIGRISDEGGAIKMRPNYERWTLRRLTEKPRCSMEPTMSCIPLRGDPICMSCFEAEEINSIEERDDNS
jgi:hypothetical protein